MYPNQILEALSNISYPGSGKNIVEAQMIEDDIRIDGKKVTFSIIFPKVNDPFEKAIIKAAEQAILTHVGSDVEVVGNISAKHPAPKVEQHHRSMDRVKKIIAVSSGKGGVGKSTVAANLAIALSRMGKKVGLLDADIFGPSIPKMFNVEDARPFGTEDENGGSLIEPIEQYGVKLLSIGFFVDPDSALIWRGAMATNAIRQLINDVNWGELDYFVIDMPPGTSDIHLTLMQSLTIDGAIIVSTPQQVALADARKGIHMFEVDGHEVPILGLVENMAWFTPAEHPDEKYYLFGKEGCKELAEERGIPLLAEIPLVQSICESGDGGAPIAINENSIVGAAFMRLAEKVL